MAKQRSSVEIFKEILGRNWFEEPDLPKFAAPKPRSTALAQYLMSHGKPGPTIKPDPNFGNVGAKSEEPGFLSRLFETLSGPLYAATNTADDMIKGGGNISYKDLGENIVGGVGRFAAGTILKPATWLPGIGDDIEKKLDKYVDDLAPEKYASDILGDLGVDNKFAKYGGGFAADVALDPLTYIPGIGIANAVRKGRRASQNLNAMAAKSDPKPEVFGTPTPIKAAKRYPKLNYQPKQHTPVQDIFRQAQNQQPLLKRPPVGETLTRGGLPPVTTQVPKVNVPVAPAKPVDQDFSWGMGGDAALRILNDPDSMRDMLKTKKSDEGWRAAQKRWGRDPDKEQAALDNAESAAAFSDRMRQHRMAKQGKVSDGKGNISQVAVTRAIESIQRGELPSFGPKPSAATGTARDIAIREADDHVTNVLGKTRTDHNPANQANLYNRLFNSTEELFRTDATLIAKFGDKKGVVKTSSPRVLQARGVMTRAMLRSAEDHMIRLGQHPTYWDGTRVRLSDILEEVGPIASAELPTSVMQAWKTKDMRRINEPVVAQAITNALARRPLHMSQMLEELSSAAQRAKDTILDGYTLPKAQEIVDQLPEVVTQVARNAGATDAEIRAVRDLIRNVIDVDKMPHEKFVSLLAGRMKEAREAGRLDVATWNKFNNEFSKILGQTKKDLMTNITGHKVVDGLGLRMSTYMGRIPEMKRFSLGQVTWGEMNALYRGRWMRNMIKGAHPDEVGKAFMIASGRLPKTEAFSPKEIELASKFEDYFKTMLDSSGLSKTSDYAGTVAERSQMIMDDVNGYLKRAGSHFQFQNGKAVKDHNGVVHDFSTKGDGWTKSWILADPRGTKQDPISFMYDMDVAIERTLTEYSLIDEFARTYGVAKNSKIFDPKVHKARLSSDRLPNEVFFEQSQRDMMERLLNDIRDGMWHPNNKLVQHYSRGIRAWKTGVTIYLPSHHIRNMIGDLHLMWWAGHNDPRDFIRARRIMHSQRTKYQDALQQDTLDALRGLTDKDALEWAKTTGKDIILKRNGVNVTAEELYVGAHQRGLLLDANKYEDLFGQAPLENIGPAGSVLSKRIARPLDGKAHQVASTVAEYREHYVRLSHFTAAVNKGLKKSKDIQKIMDDAAYEVAKWHPDGRDLTNFEQKLRLFGIPFYSWTRKAVPLAVEAMVTRPAKVLYYPRAQQALQGMLGIESNGIADPFPDDQMFPEWIRAKGIGPIGDPESENAVAAFLGRMGRNGIGFHGQEEGYTAINPSNPFNDLAEQMGGFDASPMEIARSIFDSSGPATKIPIDIMTDSTFSGAPISTDKPGGVGIGNYLASQVPIVSAANNVLEFDMNTMRPKETKPGNEPGRDIQALINYLTALGVRGTGGSTEITAEFEARDRARLAKE